MKIPPGDMINPRLPAALSFTASAAQYGCTVSWCKMNIPRLRRKYLFLKGVLLCGSGKGGGGVMTLN